MAMMATDQSSTTMIDQPQLAAPPKIPIPNDNQSRSTMDYSNFLKPNTMNNNSPSRTMTTTINVKPITLLHSEPYLRWTESEVSKMNTIENMQHVIVGKFSYGWPDLDEMRTSIPAQCNIKGDCQIGNLEDWNEVTSKRKKGWRDNGDLSALVDEVIDIAADNRTREEEVQVANNLQLAVIQEEDTVLTISNKIFVNLGYEAAIVNNSDQQITLRLKDLSSGQFLVHNSVYAKCHGALRQSLWEEIFNLSQDMTNPWSIWGNFNVVLNEEEKIWGLPINYVLADDFKTCIDSCELSQANYIGSPFTWWNARAGSDCIFERLDKVLINYQIGAPTKDWF
ncbi:hypothetical protein KY285_025456 [Solanum tuberosum]|nr:hypothetical protein KY285_025456 [Solanum tuberosum]